MQPSSDKFDVGVIVGRFQVPYLHKFHEDIIKYALEQHSKVIVVLGVTGLEFPTKENPLDFQIRKDMILSIFPSVNVISCPDQPYDCDWANTLDKRIGELISAGQSVVLYGGRDSFIPHYITYGRFKTISLDTCSDEHISGTQLREQCRVKTLHTKDFRQGVIWALQNQFPKIYTVVDIAIMNGDKVLLAKKPHDRGLRFIGGFTDVDSCSFEEDAIREAKEETGLEVSNLEYIGSFEIDDWRYTGVDKIKSVFYKAKYIFGSPKAQDDISFCDWYKITDISERDIVYGHVKLFKKLKSIKHNKLSRNLK
jgi:bifunctional NMN adenylyltransferase/nudix hydrolase